MDVQIRKLSSRKMHNIVWILVGVFRFICYYFSSVYVASQQYGKVSRFSC
jgi:hypothetical protein